MHKNWCSAEETEGGMNAIQRRLELWILMVSVRDHSFKCLGHPALGWWCHVVERVKLGVCLVLSSSSALGQMTFPVSTLASFTYKSDIMIPATCNVDSLLNNSKCNHMSTNVFPIYTYNVGYQLICGAFIQSTYVQNVTMYSVLFQTPETQKKLNTTLLSWKSTTLPGWFCQDLRSTFWHWRSFHR